MTTHSAQDALRFWFEEVTEKQRFKKDADFDALIKVRFGAAVEAALDGGFADWEADPEGRLALIILLDQFTRNIFRDEAKAFAGDDRALMLCRAGVAAGDLDALTEVTQRIFLLMLYMHSEDLAMQEEGLPLFAKYTDANTLDYAERHKVIVARWGRYPHRNAILGRETTPDERAFLDEPGSSF